MHNMWLLAFVVGGALATSPMALRGLYSEEMDLEAQLQAAAGNVWETTTWKACYQRSVEKATSSTWNTADAKVACLHSGKAHPTTDKTIYYGKTYTGVPCNKCTCTRDAVKGYRRRRRIPRSHWRRRRSGTHSPTCGWAGCDACYVSSAEKEAAKSIREADAKAKVIAKRKSDPKVKIGGTVYTVSALRAAWTKKANDWHADWYAKSKGKKSADEWAAYVPKVKKTADEWAAYAAAESAKNKKVADEWAAKKVKESVDGAVKCAWNGEDWAC